DDRAVKRVTGDLDGALLEFDFLPTHAPITLIFRAHQHLLIAGDVRRKLTPLEIFDLIGNYRRRVVPGRVGDIRGVGPAIPIRPAPTGIRKEIVVVAGEHVRSEHDLADVVE